MKQYDAVKLLVDIYEKEGVHKGSVGYIIEVFNAQAFEVEFSNKDGITIAILTLSPNEIEMA